MAENPYIEVKIKTGQLFRKVRRQKKLSLRQVEALTGIGYSWIAKFEKGQVNFEIDTLLKLASGLGIYLKELFDYTHKFVED